MRNECHKNDVKVNIYHEFDFTAVQKDEEKGKVYDSFTRSGQHPVFDL